METRVPKLIVMHGEMVEQQVELAKQRVTVGRHPHNDIVITHPAVSGQHAALTVTGGAVQVEDLGSTNGTFVNGQRIERHTLADSDIITVALHTLRYEARPATAAEKPASAALVEVLNGPNTGKKLTLNKPLTTLGSPGVLVVVIGRQDERYFIEQVDGSGTALVNGAAVAGGKQMLNHGDLLELAGTRLQFSVTGTGD